MPLTLASTWHPRGEDRRLLRLWPALSAAYDHAVFCLHPDSDAGEIDRLREQLGPRARFAVIKNWTWGRYEALRLAAEAAAACYSGLRSWGRSSCLSFC